ncbi:MAG: hypothetical protein II970_07400, partial [Paludibacteraceae bacterium]|nr:hypothetical protein [Paludibacteraceae bacterium]
LLLPQAGSLRTRWRIDTQNTELKLREHNEEKPQAGSLRTRWAIDTQNTELKLREHNEEKPQAGCLRTRWAYPEGGQLAIEN